MIRLVQLFGAHTGRVLELRHDLIRLGRMPDSEVPFHPHADLDASGRHAEIRRTAQGYEVHDVGSRNGTLVNGVPQPRALLRHGDVIEFGAGGPRLRVELDTGGSGAPHPSWGSASAGPSAPPPHGWSQGAAPANPGAIQPGVANVMQANIPAPWQPGPAAPGGFPVQHSLEATAGSVNYRGAPVVPLPSDPPARASLGPGRGVGQGTVAMMIEEALGQERAQAERNARRWKLAVGILVLALGGVIFAAGMVALTR